MCRCPITTGGASVPPDRSRPKPSPVLEPIRDEMMCALPILCRSARSVCAVPRNSCWGSSKAKFNSEDLEVEVLCLLAVSHKARPWRPRAGDFHRPVSAANVRKRATMASQAGLVVPSARRRP